MRNPLDRITTETIQNNNGDDEVIVKLDGAEVYRWHDNAQTDYPEDLCWHRIISEVFYAGVLVGRNIETTKPS